MNYKIYNENVKDALYEDIAVLYDYSNTKKDFINSKSFGNNKAKAELFIGKLKSSGYTKLDYNTNYDISTDKCY